MGRRQQAARPRLLTAYTSSAAYSVHEERLKGSLEPGMVCDLAVLDTQILDPSLSERELANATYVMTILGMLGRPGL